MTALIKPMPVYPGVLPAFSSAKSKLLAQFLREQVEKEELDAFRYTEYFRQRNKPFRTAILSAFLRADAEVYDSAVSVQKHGMLLFAHANTTYFDEVAA
jgi:hypothetical protein